MIFIPPFRPYSRFMKKLTLQNNGKFVQLTQLYRYAFANARNESLYHALEYDTSSE